MGFLRVRGERSWDGVVVVSAGLGVNSWVLGRLLKRPWVSGFTGDELRGVGLNPIFCGMGANGSSLRVILSFGLAATTS